MLGCQDFCGYYEWTFHYLRSNFGQAAVERYWERAIAADAQQHYIEQGAKEGLQGLFKAWSKTGAEERCDWTLQLDEHENLLSLVMHNCPSKGFLLQNDLCADEDYCDHCIGWIGPALRKVGVEVSAHEHNHCGQCWWEMRNTERRQQPTDRPAGTCQDSAWNRGYIDRFVHGNKQPLANRTIDPGAFLHNWFSGVRRIVVLGDDMASNSIATGLSEADAVIASGRRYAESAVLDAPCSAVVFEHESSWLAAAASRYLATPPSRRPLLMYAYLPNTVGLDFVQHDLPRPIPILPLLIRTGQYIHRPQAQYPSSHILAIMLSLALGKTTSVRDFAIVDRVLYPSQEGSAVDAAQNANDQSATDAVWLLRMLRQAGSQLELIPTEH